MIISNLDTKRVRKETFGTLVQRLFGNIFPFLDEDKSHFGITDSVTPREGDDKFGLGWSPAEGDDKK